MLQADNPSSEHQRYDLKKSESTYSKEVKEFDENIESTYSKEVKEFYENIESTYHEKEAETPNAEIEINEEDYTSSKPRRETITAKIIHD